ncbi:Predicted PurR-regulated permease PerM [Streptomyces sp. DvalAA-14]|uniref:AI-2E family transporter n=2 Tax=unclassified Streptomyces TaxID=2593676 RepID=UPI00081B0F0C|nr:AI-2E family transporter [Streptomyces sp. SID4948]MYS19014.1 AI-2E family transporter [Streptomyces sp. SID4948]SCD34057.1 Predicted PurR-regulated permease PerM [Streptomyces sp. DvalAA-14]
MPRWLHRAFLLALALVACFEFAHWVFDRLVGLLVNVLVSFFAAVAIEPAVAWMARRGMRRGLATGLVMLAVAVAGGGFLLAVGSLLVDQVTSIGHNLPADVNKVVVWVNRNFHTDIHTGDLRNKVLHSGWLRSHLLNGAGSVVGISTTVIGTVFRIFTVLLFTFYLAADGPRLRRELCSILPPARQAEALRAWDIAVVKTGGYLYSRALLAVISGVAHYILLQLLGVPFAPALGVWVGLVSQFIPTVGTYLAGALPILIAFTEDPWDALWVLIFVVVYQQFENYLLQPRITARTVEIHPAVAFGSVIAGTALLGVVGALIAIPATATLQGFFAAYVRRYEVTDPRPE